MLRFQLCLFVSVFAMTASLSVADDGRHVPLDGQPNFRDIGGYKTSDGKTIKKGIVFRSGELPRLSDADVETLERLGVKTVVNFLTGVETKSRGKDRLPNGAREISLPIETDDGLAAAVEKARSTADFTTLPPTINAHIHRILPEEGRQQYASLFREIATSDDPLVFHCSHGVHRTGTAAAILLWSMGVPWETVREDYLLSNVYRKEEVEVRLARLKVLTAKSQGITPDEVDMTNINAFYKLEGKYIDASRDQILKEYGSVERYLTDGLGLGREEIQALRQRLLESSENTASAMKASNDFAIEVYRQLAVQDENKGRNLFFSPYSIFVALTMTAEGARGETAKQMGTAIRLPDEVKQTGDNREERPWKMEPIHSGIASLNQKLMGEKDSAETAARRARVKTLQTKLAALKQQTKRLQDERKWDDLFESQKQERTIVNELNEQLAGLDQYEIRVANALWGEKSYPFDNRYVDTINRFYSTGGMFAVDFKHAYEEARLEINEWVEKQTSERIKDLIPRGALDEYTRLVLANAIYFKGEWSTPFQEERTKDNDFTRADATTVEVPMMHASRLSVGRYAAFNGDGSYFETPARIRRGQDPKELYPESDGFAMIQLPYKGGDLSMVVIAPNSADNLSVIEGQLTADKLSNWVGKLRQRETSIDLPKFKLETSYRLNEALQHLGMKRAFVDPRNPDSGAQFGGMTTSSDIMDQLYISLVLHKAFVEVNEKGTEAAAATAIAMPAATALPEDFPFTPEFKADRPFLFLIRDNDSGCILFVGRMMDPAA